MALTESNSNLQTITHGVPQGSVLGPLLFLLYVNDIENCVTDVSIKLFADDTNLFVQGQNYEKTVSKVNNSLKCLNDWFLANKLSLSVSKTFHSVFSKSSTDSNSPIVQIPGNVIQQVEYTKYLGMLVDDKLTWKKHIEYVYKKILKFVSIFNKLRYKLSLKILKMLYFSFVYPHLLYGVELYANTNKSALKNLIILNNKILRILQHSPHRTHSAVLYKKFNTLPIPDLHTFQLLLLAHKFVHHRQKLPAAFSQYFVHNYNIHNYNTRSQHDFHLQRLRTSKGQRIIKYKVSRLWNDLPDNLKEIKSLNLFKRDLKNILLINCDHYHTKQKP